MRARPRTEGGEPDRVEGASGPARAAPSAAASVLELQEAAGNRAVTGMLARNAPEPASPPGTAPAADPDEKAFDDAVAANAWGQAATALAKLPRPQRSCGR